LLIPKKHIDDIFDLPHPEYVEIFIIAKRLAPIIKSAVSSKRVGLAVEGLSVPHVHIHLIPVNEVNDLDPNKAVVGDKEKLAELALKLQSITM
jgi:histidine triad (HIT) family protein